jgi:hypothetical protein
MFTSRKELTLEKQLTYCSGLTKLINMEDTDIKDLLDVFHFELPDANQEMFYQYPSTFHPFPKIPLEIRIMIWRETFPRSRHTWAFRLGNMSCCDILQYPLPPITACINQESRSETLRKYQVLNAGLIPCHSYSNKGLLIRPQTTFWNEDRDFLCIYWSWLFSSSLIYFWHSHFINDFQSFHNSVRTLELRLYFWVARIDDSEDSHLKLFTGLREIRLIDPCTEDDTPNTGKVGGRYVGFCEKVFQDLARKDPEVSIPNIVIVRGGKPVFGPGW